MENAEQRIGVVFADRRDAKALYEKLVASGSSVGSAGGSASLSRDTVYVYIAEDAKPEAIRDALRANIAAVGVFPAAFRPESWLPQESRWSGESVAARRAAEAVATTPTLVEEIVYGLLNRP